MRKSLAMGLVLAFAASNAMAQRPLTEPRRPGAGAVIERRTDTTETRRPAATTTTTTTTASMTGQPKLAVNDNLFVMAAAAAGMAEVTTSKLAVERAGSPEVRQFAQKMVDDHTKANRELMAMAAAKGILLPTTLQYTDQAEGQSLAGLSGEDFDRCYAKGQHAAHICAVGLFTAESERGRDPEIKAWAAKTLPVLKAHKHMVKQMADAHEAKEKQENPSAH